MLEDTYGGEILSSEAPQKCKPDYEQLIAQASDRLAVNKALQHVIYEYTNFQRLRGKMAELMGELASEETWLNRRIDSLIAEQEKNNE